MSQKQDIISHFKRRSSLTKREASERYGIDNLGARIEELRKSGVFITTEMVPFRSKRGRKRKSGKFARYWYLGSVTAPTDMPIEMEVVREKSGSNHNVRIVVRRAKSGLKAAVSISIRDPEARQDRVGWLFESGDKITLSESEKVRAYGIMRIEREKREEQIKQAVSTEIKNLFRP